MANPAPTAPWNIPLFGEDSGVAPVQDPLNAQSVALNTALNTLVSQREIQTYKWANDAERNAQTGMTVGDCGDSLDRGWQYRYTSSGWVVVSGAGLTATTVRATTDSYSAGADVSLNFDASIANAPAGKYRASGVAILKASTPNAGTIKYFVNGASVGSATLDVGTLVTHVPIDVLITHTGGSLTFGVSDNRTAGTCQIYAGSRMNLAFIGAV